MTVDIDAVVLEADDVSGAEAFYHALQLTDRVHVSAGTGESSNGFRGFTLSLVVSEPGQADAYVRTASDAGAEVLKQPSKSLWGYGGAFRAPDGAVWTVASSSKKHRGPTDLGYDDLVLLLGVEDVKRSKQFYAQHGLEVAKGFGSAYAELETRGIQLALQSRRAVAKNAGVDEQGSGPHGLTVVGTAGTFTDPDGFGWRSRAGDDAPPS